MKTYKHSLLGALIVAGGLLVATDSFAWWHGGGWGGYHRGWGGYHGGWGGYHGGWGGYRGGYWGGGGGWAPVIVVPNGGYYRNCSYVKRCYVNGCFQKRVCY